MPLIFEKMVIYVLSLLLLGEGIFMLLPALVSAIYGDNDATSFLLSALICSVLGGVGALLTRKKRFHMTQKESYIIVAFTWIVFSIFGMLPYIFSGFMPSTIDAFFETVSGFTTTGATLISYIEDSTHGVLLWRSLSQWIGGMGIITLSMVLLPTLELGGMNLFSAEATLTRADKMKAKITEMARYTWCFYVILTAINAILLVLGGMSTFDSICHALSTLSTGGFSTRSLSLGAFENTYFEYVTIVFMYLGGVNFTLYYVMLIGKFKRITADDELKYYTLTVICASLVIALSLYLTGTYDSIESSLRKAFFHVIAVTTSSGFTTADYTLWPSSTITILAILMLVGTCTGSTSGGIKFMRLTIVMRNVLNEFRRAIHPTAIVPVKYNGRSITNSDVSSVLSFVTLYITVFTLGMVAISLFGFSLEDSYGLAASSLGNVGIAIGHFGPLASLASLPDPVKLIMTALMIMGRLELYTFLIVLTPSFWKER